MRVLVGDVLETSALDGLRGAGCEVRVEASAGEAGLPAAIGSFRPAVVVVRSTKVRGPAISAGGRELRLIVRAGSGTDNIDVAAARAAGVAVCNCPGMNAAAVAELTMGHLLCLDRRLVEQTAALRAGRWDKKAYGAAAGLKGRRLLVVGTGAIGIEVIRRAQAFGMRVDAQSRSLTREVAGALGVGWVAFSREALLEALPVYDAVSLHVPLTEESRGMADARFFAALKAGAMFINTTRGDVVDETAMLEAVRTKGVRVGLDVYHGQPAEKSAAWRPAVAGEAEAIVSLSHHVGASTDQAQQAVADEVVRIVRVWKETGRAEHRVA